jgi:hypothetical protein
LEAFFSVFSFGAAFSLAIVLSDFGWWTVDGLCCGGSKQKNAIQKIGADDGSSQSKACVF